MSTESLDKLSSSRNASPPLKTSYNRSHSVGSLLDENSHVTRPVNSLNRESNSQHRSSIDFISSDHLLYAPAILNEANVVNQVPYQVNSIPEPVLPPPTSYSVNQQNTYNSATSSNSSMFRYSDALPHTTPQSNVPYSVPNPVIPNTSLAGTFSWQTMPQQPHHTINVFNQFRTPDGFSAFQPIQQTYPHPFSSLPPVNTFRPMAPENHYVPPQVNISNPIPVPLPDIDIFDSPVSPPPPDVTPLLTDEDILKVPPPPPIDFDSNNTKPTLVLNLAVNKDLPPPLPKTPPPPLTPKRKSIIIKPKTKPPPVPSKPLLRTFRSEETLLDCDPEFYESVRKSMDEPLSKRPVSVMLTNNHGFGNITSTKYQVFKVIIILIH